MPWGPNMNTNYKNDPSKVIDLKVFLSLCLHKICFVCLIIVLAYSSRLLAQESVKSKSKTTASAGASGSPMDNTCRAQAKEVAVATYNTCMTEVRQKKLETLKSEFQEKVQDLKSQYEREMQKLSNDPKTQIVPETFDLPSDARMNNSQTQTPSMAAGLPTKRDQVSPKGFSSPAKKSTQANSKAKKRPPQTLPAKKVTKKSFTRESFPVETTPVVVDDSNAATEELEIVEARPLRTFPTPQQEGMTSDEWGNSYNQFNDEIDVSISR